MNPIYLPGMVPPVSGVPAVPPPPGANNANGPTYGIQSRRDWAPGEVDARQVCEATKAESLWRFSAFGNVSISITYGTLASRQILDLLAPVVITIPGQFIATATPLDDQGASCDVTLTEATASALEHARNFVDAGAGPAVALELGAVRFVALTASTLTISGAAVAVPALATVPLVAGALLNTGSGFQEFEA